MPLGHPAVLKRNICFYVVRNQLELDRRARLLPSTPSAPFYSSLASLLLVLLLVCQ